MTIGLNKENQLNRFKKVSDNPKRLSSMQYKSYCDYLREHYPICQICKSAPSQDTHHLIFGNGGADKDDRTLIAICRHCHCWCHANKHQSIAKYIHIANSNWGRFNDKNRR